MTTFDPKTVTDSLTAMVHTLAEKIAEEKLAERMPIARLQIEFIEPPIRQDDYSQRQAEERDRWLKHREGLLLDKATWDLDALGHELVYAINKNTEAVQQNSESNRAIAAAIDRAAAQLVAAIENTRSKRG